MFAFASNAISAPNTSLVMTADGEQTSVYQGDGTGQ